MAIRPSISTKQRITGSFYCADDDTTFASGATVIRQYRPVKDSSSGDNYVTPLVAGDAAGVVAVGIAQDDAILGGSVLVTLFGVSLVKAYGAVTRGAALESVGTGTGDSYGFAVAVVSGATGANHQTLGTALEDAADGALFLALICPQITMTAG